MKSAPVFILVASSDGLKLDPERNRGTCCVPSGNGIKIAALAAELAVDWKLSRSLMRLTSG